MPQIIKVLNSSVVLARDKEFGEAIVLQKGIGYGKKAGQEIELDSTAKIFTQKKQIETEKLAKLLEEIDPNYLEATDLILEYAQILLPEKLNSHIYLALTDHLHFAVQRQKENIVLTNRLFWEIKSFYPREFKIGQYGLKVVKSLLKVELPEEEAANIAFHIINAAHPQEDKVDRIRAAKLVKNLVRIITLQIPGEIDENSVHYSRFVSHIQFFVERYLKNSMLSDADGTLFEQVALKYSKAAQIASKVELFLEKEGGKKIPQEEIGYLTVHIARLLKSQTKDVL